MPRFLSPIRADAKVELSDGVNVVDEEIVDDIAFMEWLVLIQGSNGHREKMNVSAVHDGTNSQDAGSDSNFIRYGKVRTGDPGVVITVDIVGTGVSQKIRLLAEVSGTGSTVWAYRQPIAGEGA